MASDKIYVVDIAVSNRLMNLIKLQSYGIALSSISHRNSVLKATYNHNHVHVCLCLGILISYLSSDCYFFFLIREK